MISAERRVQMQTHSGASAVEVPKIPEASLRERRGRGHPIRSDGLLYVPPGSGSTDDPVGTVQIPLALFGQKETRRGACLLMSVLSSSACAHVIRSMLRHPFQSFPSVRAKRWPFHSVCAVVTQSISHGECSQKHHTAGDGTRALRHVRARELGPVGFISTGIIPASPSTTATVNANHESGVTDKIDSAWAEYRASGITDQLLRPMHGPPLAAPRL